MTKIAYVDWKIKRIRDKSILALIVLDLGAVWAMPEISLMQRVAGFFCISIPLFLMTCVLPGCIGGGDVKLMAAGGFFLGIYSICDAFVIGIIIAGAYVIWMLVVKKIDRKSEIALGTFLCTGMMCILVIL